MTCMVLKTIKMMRNKEESLREGFNIEKMVEDKLKISKNNFRRGIAKFLQNILEQSESFHLLKSQLQKLQSTQQQDELKLSQQEDEEQEIISIDDQKQFKMQNISGDILESIRREQWTAKNQHCSESLKQIYFYLQSTRCPQNQLTFLCQDLKWKLNFSFIQIDKQFKTQAIVDCQHWHNKQMKAHYTSSNKSNGRIATSLYLLLQIYSSFPTIWKYSRILLKRKAIDNIGNYQQKIHETMLQQVLSLFKLNKLHLMFVEQSDGVIQQYKEQYWKGIQSYRAELNKVVQYNKTVFSLQTSGKGYREKIEKQWKIKYRLSVDISGKKEDIEEKCISRRVKDGQQIISKKLLKHLFDNYPQFNEEMIIVSMKEGNIKGFYRNQDQREVI